MVAGHVVPGQVIAQLLLQHGAGEGQIGGRALVHQVPVDHQEVGPGRLDLPQGAAGLSDDRAARIAGHELRVGHHREPPVASPHLCGGGDQRIGAHALRGQFDGGRHPRREVVDDHTAGVLAGGGGLGEVEAVDLQRIRDPGRDGEVDMPPSGPGDIRSAEQLVRARGVLEVQCGPRPLAVALDPQAEGLRLPVHLDLLGRGDIGGAGGRGLGEVVVQLQPGAGVAVGRGLRRTGGAGLAEGPAVGVVEGRLLPLGQADGDGEHRGGGADADLDLSRGLAVARLDGEGAGLGSGAMSNSAWSYESRTSEGSTGALVPCASRPTMPNRPVASASARPTSRLVGWIRSSRSRTVRPRSPWAAPRRAVTVVSPPWRAVKVPSEPTRPICESAVRHCGAPSAGPYVSS